MSDAALKIKPKAERLARMEGTTVYKDFREGFGGVVDLTDQDVMAALAMCRRRRADKPDQPDMDDVGPECMETFFGSTQRHRRALVLAYMRATKDPGEPYVKLIARRLAATIAAQQLAGVGISRGQWSEFAYIAHTRRENLEDLARVASVWLHLQMETTWRVFDAALLARRRSSSATKLHTSRQ